MIALIILHPDVRVACGYLFAVNLILAETVVAAAVMIDLLSISRSEAAFFKCNK